MKKLRKILLVLGIVLLIFNQILFADSVDWKNEQAYYPMPVIFIHGINSNANTWSNSIDQLFNNYFSKYCEKVYINGVRQDDSNYPPEPAERYLEVYNYGGEGTDTSGSFNHLDTYASGLDEKIKKVLETYYGSNWPSNPNAKVILVGHSQGGLIARDYLRRYGATYVDRLVTMGTPLV